MTRITAAAGSIAFLLLLHAGLSGCRKEKLSAADVPGTGLPAGADSAGFANGNLAVARFNHPFGLALDQAGNLYVADAGNNIIRKINAAGIASTLAGIPGTAGSAAGSDSAATFNKPFGLATDTSGNIYVADAGNDVIRIIGLAGQVSNLAGSGHSGSADGAADSSTFATPMAVAFDRKSGNLYVADYENNTIRLVSPAGVVSTLAGKAGVKGYSDGSDTAARFNLPEGLALDGAGNLYVADNGNHMIRKISTDGQVSTLAGNGSPGRADGLGRAAGFNSPFGIAVDNSGNVYVSDSGNNLVRKVSPTGQVSTIAGSGQRGAANGIGSGASFNTPAGIVVDGSGNVYVADENNNQIRKISASGTVSRLAVRSPSVLR